MKNACNAFETADANNHPAPFIRFIHFINKTAGQSKENVFFFIYASLVANWSSFCPALPPTRMIYDVPLVNTYAYA